MTVNVNLLSADEADEYAGLIQRKSALRQPYDAMGWRLPGYVWGVIAAWFLVWAGLLALLTWWTVATSATGPSGGLKIDASTILLFIVVLVAGVVFPIVWTGHDQRRIRSRLVDADDSIERFLARIDYEARVKGSQRSDYSPEYMTTRQSQHAWYRGHSELNWTHREQGQLLGFDNADDYVNNFLESE